MAFPGHPDCSVGDTPFPFPIEAIERRFFYFGLYACVFFSSLTTSRAADLRGRVFPFLTPCPLSLLSLLVEVSLPWQGAFPYGGGRRRPPLSLHLRRLLPSALSTLLLRLEKIRLFFPLGAGAFPETLPPFPVPLRYVFSPASGSVLRPISFFLRCSEGTVSLSFKPTQFSFSWPVRRKVGFFFWSAGAESPIFFALSHRALPSRLRSVERSFPFSPGRAGDFSFS